MENQEAFYETEFWNYDKTRGEEELNKHKEYFASMLRGDMGNDIDDVLSGRIKVDVSPWKQFKFKIWCFFNKLFNKF